MNKIIKRIIFIVFIILIVIVLLIIFFSMINSNSAETQPDLPTDKQEELVAKKEIRKCEITNDYFVIKNIIKDFNSFCNELNTQKEDLDIYRLPLNEEELQEYIEKGITEKRSNAQEAIYSMLSENYIKEFNIKENDIQQKFKLENEVETIIDKIYMEENTLNVSTYIVKGFYIDKLTYKKNEFKLAMTLDLLNNTFVIYPEEYLNKHNYSEINVGEIIDIDIESIENKNYNMYKYKFIKDDEVCKEYYNNYKYSMLYNTEYAYDMLDKEYRQKRFKSLDRYKEYIDENRETLEKCSIAKYQVIGNEGEKRYICLDNYGNYYIFNQKNIGDYTIYLDTYTIGAEEFFEKYNNGTEETKSGMNAEKFFEALNMKDYNFIYEHLAPSFKDNYFENEEKLKSYLEENLFVYNDVKYKNYSKENDVNVLEVEVTDKYENNIAKKMTIVMKLEENTNFIMSFSIQ